jgi:hypothetical protein
MRLKKKSQAALEFIYTYGWMIILVIAIFSGFLRFSIFDIETFAKQRCQTEVDGLICKDYVIKHDSAIIRFENYHQSSINITDIALRPKKEYTEKVVCSGSPDDDIDDWLYLQNTEGGNFILYDGVDGAVCDMGLLDGKVHFDLFIEYYNPEDGETFKHNATGTLVAKIE